MEKKIYTLREILDARYPKGHRMKSKKRKNYQKPKNRFE